MSSTLAFSELLNPDSITIIDALEPHPHLSSQQNAQEILTHLSNKFPNTSTNHHSGQTIKSFCREQANPYDLISLVDVEHKAFSLTQTILPNYATQDLWLLS